MIWGEDNLLWVSTKGMGGTRVLKLTHRNGKTEVKELWKNLKIQIFHWEAIRIEDHVFTSSGRGGNYFSVIDVKTGKIIESTRGYRGVNSLYADGKLIMLDDGGKLSLADVTSGKLEILSSLKIIDKVTWTKPTLVGGRLIVRNRKKIMALDLGLSAGSK